jgi:hypothetical protein
MLEVVNSDGILVSQLKAFAAAGFPHLREVRGNDRVEVPSTKPCAVFLRDAR